MNELLGLAALGLLYWLPGWLFLRRVGLDLPSRFLLAVGLSYAAVTAISVGLLAAGWFTQAGAWVALGGLLGFAWLAPLPGGSIEPMRPAPRLALLAAAGFGGLMVLQAVRPGIFRLWDAVSTWAPLTREIATGTYEPDWLPTLLEGFPPSIALLTGTAARLMGGFTDLQGFVVHPLFSAMYLMTVVMLGTRLGGRRAGWIALLVVLAATPLVRGIYFHDDLIVAFLVALAALTALRAGPAWQGWAAAGAIAGGAVAVKHLGVLGAMFVGIALIARLPNIRAWIAAAAGWLIGLPWYLWNAVRFGNPVHPLLPGLLGADPEVIRLIEDNNAARLVQDRANPLELGGLTIALVIVGVVAALVRVARADSRQQTIYVGLAILGSAVFFVVWLRTGFATRHLLSALSVIAAIAGVGLAIQPRDEVQATPGPLAIVALAALILVTGLAVRQDFYQDVEPADAAQTGVFSVLQGKWRDLDLLAEPPADPMVLFGRITEAWEELNKDPEAVVVAFDHRRFYVKPRIISAVDRELLPMYDAATIEAQHEVIVSLGVDYMLDRPARGLRHPLYPHGPWRVLADHPELFRPITIRPGFVLYEVVGVR